MNLLEGLFSPPDPTPEEAKALAKQAAALIEEEDEAAMNTLTPGTKAVADALAGCKHHIRLVNENEKVGHVLHIYRVDAFGCDCCNPPEMKIYLIAYVRVISRQIVYREIWTTGNVHLMAAKLKEYERKVAEAKRVHEAEEAEAKKPATTINAKTK